jgi:Pentapeptide repeats (8 copies)
MDQSRKRRWLRAPSPAMIVACIALFVALGGTSYAAIRLPANSVGTKQIKNSAVTGVKVKNATLTGAKIKNATLTGAKIKDASLTGADIVASTLGKVPSAASADSVVDGAVGPAKFGTIPGARVRRTAAVTVPGNASGSTVLSYDATDFNVGGVFNSTQPSRMTAPVAGRYLIVATARWESNANGRRTIALEVNGTAAQIARSNISAFWFTTATFNPEQTAEAIYKLSAGDYVEVLAYQDSGSALTLLTGVDNGVTFSMEWIAP